MKRTGYLYFRRPPAISPHVEREITVEGVAVGSFSTAAICNVPGSDAKTSVTEVLRFLPLSHYTPCNLWFRVAIMPENTYITVHP